MSLLILSLIPVIAIGLMIAMWVPFVRRRRGVPADNSVVSPLWLERHVFNLPAEVVGAIWHDRVTHYEAAAVLIRLLAQKKLRGTIERDETMTLEITAAPNAFVGRERDLVDALFAGERDMTRDRLVERCVQARAGIDFGAVIATDVEESIARLVSEPRRGDRFIVVRTVIFAPIALTCCLAFSIDDPTHKAAWLLTLTGGLLLFVALVSLGVVGSWRSKPDRPLSELLRILWPAFAALAIGIGAGIFFRANERGVFASGGFAALALMIFSGLLGFAQSYAGPGQQSLRMRFSSAEKFLRRFVASSHGRIAEAWLPYLMAFEIKPPNPILTAHFNAVLNIAHAIHVQRPTEE